MSEHASFEGADTDDILTREYWLSCCESRCLLDGDGYGYIIGGRSDGDVIVPSEASNLPPDCTHIRWLNK